MRLPPVKLALLLLLYAPALFAEQPPQLMVENRNKAMEGQTAPAVKSAAPAPGRSVNNSELKDPTLMNQNFRDALTHAPQNKTGTVAPGASMGPVLPKMSLLASVYGGKKNKNSAMLSINDRTEMVYIGDKITTLESNQVVEIQILDIQKHQVKVRVLPANETIILR